MLKQIRRKNAKSNSNTASSLKESNATYRIDFCPRSAHRQTLWQSSEMRSLPSCTPSSLPSARLLCSPQPPCPSLPPWSAKSKISARGFAARKPRCTAAPYAWSCRRWKNGRILGWPSHCLSGDVSCRQSAEKTPVHAWSLVFSRKRKGVFCL